MDRKLMIDWLNEGNIAIPIKLLKDYKKLGLVENEVMLLIHVYTYIQQGVSFPTPIQLASRMSLKESDCLQILQMLCKRGFIELEERSDENNIRYEVYSLAALWDKLILLSVGETAEVELASKEIDENELYQLFESEFGRPLSPMECELITMWLDQDKYSPSIIKAALLEGVVSGKRNLRYIDRILIEWNKNGIHTVQQAREYGEKFRGHQYRNNQPKKAEPAKQFPSYNWLND